MRKNIRLGLPRMAGVVAIACALSAGSRAGLAQTAPVTLGVQQSIHQSGSIQTIHQTARSPRRLEAPGLPSQPTQTRGSATGDSSSADMTQGLSPR